MTSLSVIGPKQGTLVVAPENSPEGSPGGSPVGSPIRVPLRVPLWVVPTKVLFLVSVCVCVWGLQDLILCKTQNIFAGATHVHLMFPCGFPSPVLPLGVPLRVPLWVPLMDPLWVPVWVPPRAPLRVPLWVSLCLKTCN